MSWNQNPLRSPDYQGMHPNRFQGMVKVLPTQYITSGSFSADSSPHNATARLHNFPHNGFLSSEYPPAQVSTSTNHVPKIPPPPKNFRIKKQNMEQRHPTLITDNIQKQNYKSMHDLRFIGAGQENISTTTNFEMKRSLCMSSQDIRQASSGMQPDRYSPLRELPPTKPEPVQTHNRRRLELEIKIPAPEPPVSLGSRETKGIETGEYDSLHYQMNDLKKELAAMKGPMQEHEEWLKNQSSEIKELKDLQSRIETTLAKSPIQSPKVQKVATQTPSFPFSKTTAHLPTNHLASNPELPTLKKDLKPPITSPKPCLASANSTENRAPPAKFVYKPKPDTSYACKDINNNSLKSTNTGNVKVRPKSLHEANVTSRSSVNVKRMSQLFEASSAEMTKPFLNSNPPSRKLSPALLQRAESMKKLPETISQPKSLSKFKMQNQSDRTDQSSSNLEGPSNTKLESSHVTKSITKPSYIENKSVKAQEGDHNTKPPKQILNASTLQSMASKSRASSKKAVPPTPPPKPKDHIGNDPLAQSEPTRTKPSDIYETKLPSSSTITVTQDEDNHADEYGSLQPRSAVEVEADTGTKNISEIKTTSLDFATHRYENVLGINDMPTLTNSRDSKSAEMEVQRAIHDTVSDAVSTLHHRYSNVTYEDEHASILDASNAHHEAQNIHGNSLKVDQISKDDQNFSRKSIRKSIRPSQPPPLPPSLPLEKSVPKFEVTSSMDNARESPTNTQHLQLLAPTVTEIPEPPPPPILPSLPPQLVFQSEDTNSRKSSVSSLPSTCSSSSKTDLMEQIRKFKQSGQALRKIDVSQMNGEGPPTVLKKNAIHAALQTRFLALHGERSDSSSEDEQSQDDDEWSA